MTAPVAGLVTTGVVVDVGTVERVRSMYTCLSTIPIVVLNDRAVYPDGDAL